MYKNECRECKDNKHKLEHTLYRKTRENTITLTGCWKSTYGSLPVLISTPQHLLLCSADAVLLPLCSTACLLPGSQTVRGILIFALAGAKYLL